MNGLFFRSILEQKESDGEPLTVDDLLDWCAGDATGARKRILLRALALTDNLAWDIAQKPVFDPFRADGKYHPGEIRWVPVDPYFLDRIAENLFEQGIPINHPRHDILFIKAVFDEPGSSLVVKPKDFRKWLNKSFPQEDNAEKETTETKKKVKAENEFRLQSGFWNITFRGDDLPPVKNSVNIKAIAERLAAPGEPIKHTVLCASREDIKSTDGLSDSTGDVNPESIPMLLEKKLRETHNTIEKKLSRGQECENEDREYDKMKNYLEQKGHRVNDAGQITWSEYADYNRQDSESTSVYKKEEDAHRQRINRGVKEIEKINADLTDFLTKHVKPHKYYLPPTDFPDWDIIF